MSSPTAPTTGDASGTGPASASVASRGGDDGNAASSGGSSSAPASQSSASAAPKQGVDAADGDGHVSSPKDKGSGDSKSHKSSSGKQPSGKLRKSSLVSKSYVSLTPKELLTIEAPDTHCSSWLYYGIPVQPTSDTKTAIGQTPGFPDFEPHRHSLGRLKKRWNSKKYQALLDEVPAPWEVMYQNRRTKLYFHRREDLCPLVQADIEELASLTKKHAQALWERTHWVVMDPDADLLSGEQHKERGLRRVSLLRQYRAAVSKVLKHKDFPETLMFEPGIWKVPDKYCPWIWQDPRAHEIGGPKCLSLRKQLEAIDSAEPARTQWATASADKDWMQFVPSDLRKQALTPGERAENPVSMK